MTFFFLILLNLSKVSLVYSLIIGVIITICSNNWISMWIGLEISIISFIPIMQNINNNISSESIIKYFLVQRIASTLILMRVTCILVGIWIKNDFILIMSILIKIGLVPFHNWLLTIIEFLETIPIFLLFTVIKIPPMSILYQINCESIEFPIILSILVSSLSCLNQRSIKKLLSFSSIYGVSIMLCCLDKFYIMIVYLFIYRIILLILINILDQIKINYINQILFNEKSIWIKINLWINILSIRGFPLTLGFSIKIFVIQNVILNHLIIICLIIVLTSMFSIIFYIRLAFMSLFLINLFKKWRININKSINYIFIINLLFTPIFLGILSII